jgi:acetyl-CoA carboxylase biotin carboxyl carrier protein
VPRWLKPPRLTGRSKLAVDPDTIRELNALLAETGLSEIEIEQDGQRIRVARNAAPSTAAAVPAMPSDPAMVPPITPVEAPVLHVDPAKHPGAVVSPMVGTAYRATEPGAKPLVEIGSVVKTGDPLLIIEAMKVLNQIPSPRDGTVKQILFEDAQPVEFGEPLMIIE